MSTVSLFTLCTAIWGSTWLAITWQLGVVPPTVSVAWRFALAGVLLGAWCAATGRSLRFPPAEHARLAAWGAMNFGLNYVFVYLAETHVSSGLVAVVFSTIVIMSPIGMRVFFGQPLSARLGVAAGLGVGGVALLFLPELGRIREGGAIAAGIGYALAATALATGGNLVAVRNHRAGLPLFPATAWGMLYGALIAAAVAAVLGDAWTFDARASYVLSLLYLAVFGSVVAFGAYLTLLGRIGAGPSSYVGVSTPVVAMLLTTLFEGYVWTATAVLGVALAVAGNVMALHPRRRA